jgi:hypothetical protein
MHRCKAWDSDRGNREGEKTTDKLRIGKPGIFQVFCVCVVTGKSIEER